MSNNTTTVMSEATEALSAAGECIVKLGGSLVELGANSTHMGAKAMYLTVDTANIGTKEITAWMADDGEQLLAAGAALFADAKAEAEALTDELKQAVAKADEEDK